MSIEDLKSLRNHLDLAISMMELGDFKDMDPYEMAKYKRMFGKVDIVIGNFMITIVKRARDIEP